MKKPSKKIFSTDEFRAEMVALQSAAAFYHNATAQLAMLEGEHDNTLANWLNAQSRNGTDLRGRIRMCLKTPDCDPVHIEADYPDDIETVIRLRLRYFALLEAANPLTAEVTHAEKYRLEQMLRRMNGEI